jgi:S-adenosylmethionine:tRNA ribosyltransferase-isomerase
MNADSHSLADYDYHLPPGLIAQKPLPERSSSRLLVLDRTTGVREHRAFGDLPDLLLPGDLLVLNRSRVLPARLLGRRPGGGKAEILLVRRRGDDLWDALLRPGRRLRPGLEVEIAPTFRVRIEEPSPTRARGASPSGPLRLVRLLSAPEDSDAALARFGHMPLPPYIHRPDDAADRERYQTVYARETGSVAAPTAGLHFTPALLESLRARGVALTELVLHVGPGTFRPVEVDDVRQHRVDPEQYTIPPETAAAVTQARAEGRRVVAVGTTTTRALEAAASPSGRVLPVDDETDLFIRPGHRFQVVDALITNFHLPRSSLLLLVSALAGRRNVLAAYADAVKREYRFYSYGDAMLVR